MPKYLIHVGPHKTGTTYLQFRLDALRQPLRENGTIYPTDWSSSETEPSHRKLMVGLQKAHVAELSAQFEAIERAKPESVLISGEGLNLLESGPIELLKTLLGSNPVTIIFYCRRWSELLPSLWQEKVKHGHDETFPEFLADHATDPFASPVINFAKRLGLYASVFGRRNIALVSYSNLCDDGIDLAEHFFHCFLPRHRRLVDGLPAMAATRPNRSLPPIEVEVIRALNQIHSENGMQAGAALRNWYMANAKRFDLSGLLSAIRETVATVRFSDAEPEAQQLHDMLFGLYGDLMVQPVTPRRLFSPRTADMVYFNQNYPPDRRTRRTLEGLYAGFCEVCDPVMQ